MIDKHNNIRCDDCGQFIKLDDLASGKATNSLYTPDSDFTREIWESQCARCKEKANANPQ